MGKVFAVFFERVKSETSVTTQQGLADALGVNRSAITQAKNLDRVPQKWFLQLSRRFGLSPDWLEYGIGMPRPGRESGNRNGVAKAPVTAPVSDLPGSVVYSRSSLSSGAVGARFSAPTMLSVAENDGATLPGRFFQVPKVGARLSAGGGSFEVGGQAVGSRAFDLAWLQGMGRPSEMVLMDVVGNSMAPGICDGDTVLVDQAQADLVFGSIYAVGHEDAVLVKRVRRARDGLALVSDNPEFAPILLSGDELSSFRIIGRVVWLCREL